MEQQEETQYHSEPIHNARELIEALQNVPSEKWIIFSIMDGADTVWVRNIPTDPYVMVIG